MVKAIHFYILKVYCLIWFAEAHIWRAQIKKNLTTSEIFVLLEINLKKNLPKL